MITWTLRTLAVPAPRIGHTDSIRVSLNDTDIIVGVESGGSIGNIPQLFVHIVTPPPRP